MDIQRAWLTVPVTADSAYRYTDNYQIVGTAIDDCVGVEHNEQEAKAIARYLEGKRGISFRVFKNTREAVKQARAIRKDHIRVPGRERILKEMGVWK